MKRLIAIVSILVLIPVLALFALAAGGGQATVTSAGGVSPGESITFTVSISGADPIRAVMLEPTYDREAFELISGKFTRSGMIADFTEGNGVIAWSEPTDPNGSILTFTLKAKDTVKSGTTYSVGCQYSVRDGNDELQYCTAVSSTVTVLCSHSFTEKKAEQQYLCGAATCTAPAKYYISCHKCGAAGTETFEQGAALGHDYSAQNTDAKYAKVAATCKLPGEYYFSCTHCGAADTKTFKTKTPGDHIYDHNCDTDCNECGATRTTTHDYQWQSDEKQHWQECTACKDKQEAQNHTPGGAATQTEPQLCTTCQRVIAPALAHIHNYGDGWAYDEGGHWHACECGNIEDLGSHIWTDPTGDNQTVCSVCGATEDFSVALNSGADQPVPTAQSKKPVNVWKILLWVALGLSLAANGFFMFMYFKKKKK